MNKFKKFINRLDSIGLESERNLFIENIALLIASGIDIASSLVALKQETKSRPMKRIIGEIEEDVNSGSAFWRALDKIKIFSPHTISLIKIGEESGRLEENLKVISIQEEKDREFKSKLHSAMMYPIFVFGLTIVIGVVVAWFILPRLSSVFSSMKMELPLVTRILIAAGNFLQDYGFIFIPLLLSSIGLATYFIFFFSRTKFIGQAILFSLPGSGRLIQQIELSRFGYMLGTLITSGITINEALRSLIEASNFAPYKNFYRHLLEKIEDGNSFQKSFSSYKGLERIIPFSVQQMVVNGEKTGFLSEVLLKIGLNYEKKIEDTTKNLTVILEPVLLVIVWLGVVAVAVAVILPIYSLIGGFSTGVSQKQTPRPAPMIVPVIVENEVATTSLENLIATSTLETEIATSTFESSISTSSPEEISVETLPRIEIPLSITNGLNIRQSPSTESEIISNAKAGESFEYFDKRNGFYGIFLADKIRGWVAEEFVVEIN